MWKKQEDAVDTPLELGAQRIPDSPSTSVKPSPSVNEDLNVEHSIRPSEKAKSANGPQRVIAEVPPPSKAATMAAYTEAVSEVTKNATAFIEHLPLLGNARDAYDRAMKASAELRRVLDTDEEHLRSLMTQLAQVLNDHVVKPAPEKKKPEIAKLEATRGTEASTADVKRFP
jgi:hypothetical protein